jgi:hypothetical protein
MTARRVWIAQCLCPARHAILASVGEAESYREARDKIMHPLRAQVEELVGDGTLNPFCGICYAPSDTWRYEVGRTRFTTMAEALPTLKETEAKQLATAAILGGDKKGGRA